MRVQLLLFLMVLSLDAFTAGIAYGAEKIKIGFGSGIIISLFGGFALLLSAWVGNWISGGLSETFCKTLSFVILFFVGLFNFIQGAVKSYIKRRRESGASMHFKLHGLDFFVEVLMDETKADADHSSYLSTREAAYLAAALSVDSLAAGIGAGFAGMSAWQLGAGAVFMNLFAVFCGCLLGRLIASCSRLELSWLGGAVLILLAFFRFLT